MAIIRLNKAYAPLLHCKTRYIIMTGGRGSGKSFALAVALLDRTYDDGYNILYTRYNMTSAEISIIPEYKEKIDLGNCANAFLVRRRDVVNVATGSQILFRGLQQSGRNQIARMKSLARLKIWVLDEAQELMSEKTFDTVDDSIRVKAVDNLVILSLNPTCKSHWICKRFFTDRRVPYDYNGIKDDVTYIHTDYRSNLANLNQSFIDKAERIRIEKPDRYANVYLGEWEERKSGLIYTNWEEIPAAEYPEWLPQWWGNDWGFSNDPDALVRLCFDPLTRVIYVKEIAYRNKMQPADVARSIKEDAKGLPLPSDKIAQRLKEGDNTQGYKLEDCIVYCDPARPEHIAALRANFGISAMAGINKDKTGRIGWLQGFRVRYVGEHIREEVEDYSWKPASQDEDTFTDTPQDGNDHAMDAINYAAVTHLRRLGIMPD